MFKSQRVQSLLALFLSSAGLFLSSWIVIPAPTMSLLALAIGAPEISPWLLGLNAIALILALPGSRHRWLPRLALGMSLLGFCLSALPLAQLPTTQQRLAIAWDAFGAGYSAQVPKQDIQNRWGRPHPFVLADVFRGIESSEARYTAGILFAAPAGEQLSMDIYRPPLVGKYPAIVVIYGGAWQSGEPGYYPDFSRYLAAQGYTVFAIDYRHAPRYQFPAQLDDVRTALTFIRQHADEYEADVEQMALIGRSAGAHLAMLAAYQPDALPVQAVISYYGPTDLAAAYVDPPRPDPLDIRSVLETFLGGSPDELLGQYRLASPISYVTRSLPPTLLIHGSRDNIVEAKFARRLLDRLHTTNTPAALLEIPWAGHSFDAVFQGLSNQLALYYTERFLASTLLQTEK